MGLLRTTGFRFATLFCVFSLLPSGMGAESASRFILARKTADGKIHYETIEGFQIAQNSRVRLLDDATTAISSERYKRLPRVELTQAGVIRVDENRNLVRISPGQPKVFVLPADLAIKSPIRLDRFTGQMHLAAVNSRNRKQTSPIPFAEFLAVIPALDPAAETARFALDDRYFVDWREQLAAIEGSVQSFGESPARETVRSWLENKLQTGLAAYEDGGAYDNFLVIHEFAGLAGRAFFNDPHLKQLYHDISSRKKFTDTAVAALRALAQSNQWDSFLDQYANFEPYQWSFSDLMGARDRALQQSARLHFIQGHDLIGAQKYAEAVAEFTRANRADPDNSEIGKALEDAVIRATQAEALNQQANRRRLAKGSPEDILFGRRLDTADRAIKDKDFEKALSALADAENFDKLSPEIPLRKARILQGRNELAPALAMLDEYDRLVVDPGERQKGEEVRREVLYDLEKQKNENKRTIDGLFRAGEYTRLSGLLEIGLKLDPNDEDFNYYGGIVAGSLRHNDRAKDLLKRYLALSNSLRGDLKRRALVRRILTKLETPAPASSTGTANWFSGRKLPESLLYCPESGAFQARINSIKAYKLQMSFSWADRKLRSIETKFEDEKGQRNYSMLSGDPAVEKSGSFSFQYYPGTAQVMRVAVKSGLPDAVPDVRLVAGNGGQLHWEGPDKTPLTVLQSNPILNPGVVATLQGPVATGIAGNSFFNPFVWDGIHYFTLAYDNSGRIETAREWGADNLLRFTWDGQRLMEIRAFRANSNTPYYRRVMSYTGGRLLMETVESQGKTGKIRYTYAGDLLQEARLEDDAAPDGKTWRVHFESM